MSVQFNTAQSIAEQYRLPPPPDPQVDPAGYDQWLQGNAAYVAEPAYHPQFGQLFAANDPQAPVPAGSFSDEVRGQLPQAGIDHDLALLSEDVYNAESTNRIGAGNWTRVQDADLPPGISTPRSSDATGFQAAIYTDGNGRYVLAFAGTDPTSIPDWIANGGQGLGFETAQYRDAMALAQEASAEWGDNLVITGHSLGGGLASAAALATDSPAVTFNAAGLSDETLRSLNFTPNGAREVAADGLVRRYNVQNDILTGAQQGVSPLPDAVGYELRLDNTYLIKDPIRAHLMPAVLRGLENGHVTPIETSPLDTALARPGEAVLDVAGNVIREGVGLVGDVASVATDLTSDVVDAGRDLVNGRPVDAALSLTGDVVDAGLNLTGDIVDRSLNLAGDTVQASGNLVGGLVRDLGNAVGLDGAGRTVGGWIEDGSQWLGNGLDTAGTWVNEKLDTAGAWVSDQLDTAGDWATDRLTDAGNWVADRAVDAGNWVADRATDVGNWVGDRASDVGNWAGDRWNDFKESGWNPGNWF
ncbi:MAG: DUF2974 domain-containing protein [Luteimonas sp.]|nr:DUF2974 domain-containing protein [Luteimonas sp.]